MTTTPSTRPDPTKCFKGLHDWIPENLYTDGDGHTTCRLCKNEARLRHLRGEAHPKNSDHCRRGHKYTPENTRKKVRFVKGVKTIQRGCRQCEEDAKKTTAQR